jgi:hypothetical protein
MEKNGNALVVECHDDAGTMKADLTKDRQTMFNLMSNAAKGPSRINFPFWLGRPGRSVERGLA